LLNRKLKGGEAEDLAIVNNVPVWMPTSGGASITLPVKQGDVCLLVFVERSLDEWLTGDGQEKMPEDARKHAINDAVAFVGLRSFGMENPADNGDDVLIRFNDAKISIKPDGKVVIDADKVEINAPNTDINGDLKVKGVTSVGSLISRGDAGSAGVFTGVVTATKDVISQGKSLVDHSHIDSLGGQTTPPLGG
jgi:hypothetical protein